MFGPSYTIHTSATAFVQNKKLRKILKANKKFNIKNVSATASGIEITFA